MGRASSFAVWGQRGGIAKGIERGKAKLGIMSLGHLAIWGPVKGATAPPPPASAGHHHHNHQQLQRGQQLDLYCDLNNKIMSRSTIKQEENQGPRRIMLSCVT